MVLATGIPTEFYSQYQAFVRIEPRCRSNDWANGLQARTADPLWMLARQWQTGEFKGEDVGSPVQVKLHHSTQTLHRIRLGNAETAFDILGKKIPGAPLEAIIEQERFKMDWRTRVKLGQQFERFVRAEMAGAGPEQVAKVISAYRQNYPLELPTSGDEEWVNIDNATRRYVELMQSRVVDGERLLVDLPDRDDEELTSADIRVPALAGIIEAQRNEAVKRLNSWRRKLHLAPNSRTSDAWQNERLEYSFEFEAQDGTEIKTSDVIAPEYRNGALDWHTFLMKDYAGDDGQWDSQKPVVTLPTRTSVGGISPRWWAFEDATIDFGNLDVAKPDLSKLLLMEFALIYGDDYFSVPVPLELSEMVNDALRMCPKLSRIDSLTVTNVFGEPVEVKPARQVVRDNLLKLEPNPANSDEPQFDVDDPLLRWEMFTLSPSQSRSASTDADVLLIPPVVGFREESSPLEEVRFLRDEGANMVWAVEHLVQNGKGQPVDGFDAQRERIERQRDVRVRQLLGRQVEIEDLLRDGGPNETETQELEAEAASNELELARLRDGPQPASGGAPRYRLATTVPENWFPFVPTNASPFFGLNYKSVRLRRAQMRRNAEGEGRESMPAMTRILDPSSGDPLLWLEESAVPRSGLRTQLTAQRVRGVDGKTFVWMGRKVTAGKGEANSGLRFDRVDEGKAR